MQEKLRALLSRPVEQVGDAEIVADAARILRDLMRVEADARDLLARVDGALTDETAEPAAPYDGGSLAGLTLHDAARRALAAAGGPLHVRDLGARIKAGGWRHPRANHARADLIEFQLAARLPRFPSVFRRVAPNTFGLAGRDVSTPAPHPKPRLGTVRTRGTACPADRGRARHDLYGAGPVALVLDTGVIFAALVTKERDHQACRALLEEAGEPLVVPAPVFVEVGYLLRRRATLHRWLDFSEDVAAGAYTVFPLDAAGVLAAARLQDRYRDLPLGFVDAAVFTCCVALGERRVATLDRRHFSVLRTEKGQSLELLPVL